jgi:nucleoid-associated protein YgaU
MEEASRLLGWADENNIATRFPSDYNEGRGYVEAGVASFAIEEWNDSINSSVRAIELFTMLQTGGTAPLPSQYTVRTWANERDCLWNIAGYPWVYGDPWRWRELYNANRARMPQPNNPDLIEPGFILEIPSIRGEVRQGMWDPNRTYRP